MEAGNEGFLGAVANSAVDVVEVKYGDTGKEAQSKLVEDTLELPVQVNGKLRGKVTVPADADQDAIIEAAQADENVAGHLEGKTVRKAIVVPKKLVNLVVG